MAIIEMDSWEMKERVMEEKKNLRDIY